MSMARKSFVREALPVSLAFADAYNKNMSERLQWEKFTDHVVHE